MTHDAKFSQEDIERNKLLAALSYVWILFILYWIVDSPFVKFHAKQSLVIFLAEMGLWILGIFAGGMIPMWGMISSLLFLLLLALRIVGFINALTGKAAKLPVVGDMAESLGV
ncbi:MAG: hypothetical protein GXO29_01010 [Thermotogae bacterium]|nr:hypothetical protein [Thermotogota bacterium]